MEQEEDRAPLQIVRIVVSVLPLMLKLGVLYLKYKRRVKRREKILRKELARAGMDDWMIEGLCEDMDTISIRDFMSIAGDSNPLDEIPIFN